MIYEVFNLKVCRNSLHFCIISKNGFKNLVVVNMRNEIMNPELVLRLTKIFTIGSFRFHFKVVVWVKKKDENILEFSCGGYFLGFLVQVFLHSTCWLHVRFYVQMICLAKCLHIFKVWCHFLFYKTRLRFNFFGLTFNG